MGSFKKYVRSNLAIFDPLYAFYNDVDFWLQPLFFIYLVFTNVETFFKKYDVISNFDFPERENSVDTCRNVIKHII